MFLHLGMDESVRKREIVGIFDLDNTTLSKDTRDFLSLMQKDKKIISLSNKLPKAFVLADNELTDKVYITDLPTKSIVKRLRTGKGTYNER